MRDAYESFRCLEEDEGGAVMTRGRRAPRDGDVTFNLATWNIRELGRRRRLKASLHYIAEILNSFDLIAVTEVRDNLDDLNRILQLLGPYWRALYSDFIPDPAGNRERIAYVYDTRMVTFTGLAAEADPPRKKNRTTGRYESTITWWRSPYLASFRAGNFDFTLLTAHIRWGAGASDRLQALQELAALVHARREGRHAKDRDMIVVGDFNIPDVEGPLFEAITRYGLQIPRGLRGVNHGTNLARNKRYDQILHYATHPDRFTDRGGVLDFYRGDHRPLYPGRKMGKRGFTYEISDHLPLWVQVNCDVGRWRLRRG